MQHRFTTTQKAYLPFKRFFDIVLSLAALIIFSPVFLVVAIIIKIDSPGPAIFRQKRAGKDEIPFIMYKFRSMYKDAEADGDLLDIKTSGDRLTADAINQILENEPRITRFGKIIRKSSIDELPQFFNVLTGSMSLVGPRPRQFWEHELLDENSRKRILVRPGITCFWQVSGRSTLDEQTRRELDVLYIQKLGFLTDLMLLIKTIPAVLRGEGAY